jgi:hypothetical protein
MCKECRHVMPTGLHCQSPAMRGSAFCYFHARTQRPGRQEARIEIPPVLDPAGTLYVLNQIVQALGSGLISNRRAAVLLYAVQMASGDRAAPLPARSPLVTGNVPGRPVHPTPKQAMADLQALSRELAAFASIKNKQAS